MEMENFYKRFCREAFDDNGVLCAFEPVVADNFNFAYDVVDEIARLDPDRRAMVWCNVAGEERTFTFGEMKLYSDAPKCWRITALKKAIWSFWCLNATMNSGLRCSLCIKSEQSVCRQQIC
jgi:hypothetical protein